MLSAIGFEAIPIARDEIEGYIRSAVLADLDSDGDEDVLFSTRGTVGWYENEGGDFGEQTRIPTIVADALVAADVDRDGDLDIIGASHFGSSNHSTQWYENLDGKARFGEAKHITSEGDRLLVSTDLDNDGDVDILTRAGNSLVWYENENGSGSFREAQRISASARILGTLSTADLDGDGDLDILASSLSLSGSGSVFWYQNTNGEGQFGESLTITNAAEKPRSTLAADLDVDGDLDVIVAARDGLTWHTNLNGEGVFGSAVRLDTAHYFGGELTTADMNADGTPEIIVSNEYQGVLWYKNNNTPGEFEGPHPISSRRAGQLLDAADIDLDGDPDVVVAFGETISWHENTDGAPSSEQRHLITEHGNASSVEPVDIDGDGDIDVIVASHTNDVVTWRENLDGKGEFSVPRPIAADLGGPETVRTADIDGDGDLDVFSGSGGWPSHSSRIAWHENADGEGTFGRTAVLDHSEDGEGDVSLAPADLDGDGDIDLLAAISNNILWYENADSRGNFSDPRIIAELDVGGASPSPNKTVYPADLDGDGDLDVLAALHNDQVVWFENLTGDGLFSGGQMIGSDFTDVISSVAAADMDGDGDKDVLLTTWREFVWYENMDGVGVFGPKNLIASDKYFFMSLVVADMNRDGHLDALTASRDEDWGRIWSSHIGLYLNVDGRGTLVEQRELPTLDGQGPLGIRTADVDGDHDLDVIAANAGDLDTAVTLYSNRRSGDVDDDGLVELDDFLALAANFGRDDAGWAQGDLDGNQVVDFADFLILSNNYEAA